MYESSLQILNWDAPNGALLKKFIKELPQDRPIVLNVFGSTPLQMRLDPSFLSGDVDMFTSEDLSGYLEKMKLGKEHATPYIELVPSTIFITTPAWRDRAAKEVFGNVTVYIASPLDVLVGKLKRLEAKDVKAFDLVKAKTGGPTEEELKQALRLVVDMYRPAFDEENPGGDPIANTRRLWMHLYGHDIDVRREIIVPAIEVRKEAYGENAPDRRSILREIAEESAVYGAAASSAR
jgi:hypothetical protein